MAQKLLLYDTTLRDGTQSEGISLSVDDKLKITKRLDEFGVQYIEGGWPGSNPKDVEYFERVRELNLKNAKIAAFGSTRRKNSDVKDDPNIKALVDAQTPVVTVVGKSWDLHVSDVLEATPEENLKMIEESIAYLKGLGKEVVYDAEHFFDGYQANPSTPSRLSGQQNAAGRMSSSSARRTAAHFRGMSKKSFTPSPKKRIPIWAFTCTMTAGTGSRIRSPGSTRARSMCRGQSTVTASGWGTPIYAR